MKYYLYNKLSSKVNNKYSTKWVDVLTLSDEFYKNLTNEDEVILVGGDGTINQFINKCDIYPKLTIYPRGTGNDLVRSLTNEFTRIPIYQANETKFINGFGVGFDALVCSMVNEGRKKGKVSFPLAVYKALFKSKIQTINAQIDEVDYSFENSFFVTIQNGKYFGGGVLITPNQNIESEKLSLCAISNGSKGVLATLFPTALIGKHTFFKKYVTIVTGNKFKISLTDEYISQCDGEVLLPTTEFVIGKIGEIEVRKDERNI